MVLSHTFFPTLARDNAHDVINTGSTTLQTTSKENNPHVKYVGLSTFCFQDWKASQTSRSPVTFSRFTELLKMSRGIFNL